MTTMQGRRFAPVLLLGGVILMVGTLAVQGFSDIGWYWCMLPYIVSVILIIGGIAEGS